MISCQCDYICECLINDRQERPLGIAVYKARQPTGELPVIVPALVLGGLAIWLFYGGESDDKDGLGDKKHSKK